MTRALTLRIVHFLQLQFRNKRHGAWWRIKWKHFSRYWPFVRGIHRSPVNSTHKGQWRGALMFSLICVWTNNWVNKVDTGELRRHRTHYDVIVMDALLFHIHLSFYVYKYMYIWFGSPDTQNSTILLKQNSRIHSCIFIHSSDNN